MQNAHHNSYKAETTREKKENVLIELPEGSPLSDFPLESEEQSTSNIINNNSAHHRPGLFLKDLVLNIQSELSHDRFGAEGNGDSEELMKKSRHKHSKHRHHHKHKHGSRKKHKRDSHRHELEDIDSDIHSPTRRTSD